MSRVADLFEQLTLPEITRILRRTAVVGLVIATVALVGFSVLGHWMIGAGACIGLALGLLNIRLVTSSVARIGSSGGYKARHRIASNTLLRLGVMLPGRAATGLEFAAACQLQAPLKLAAALPLYRDIPRRPRPVWTVMGMSGNRTSGQGT